MRRRHFSDKELRSVGIRARVGHSQASGTIKDQAGVKFVFKLIARPAGTLSQRIAALNHEAGNYPMKNSSVIQWSGHLLAALRIGPLLGACCKANKILYCLGCIRWKEFAREVPGRGMENGGGSGLGWGRRLGGFSPPGGRAL